MLAIKMNTQTAYLNMEDKVAANAFVLASLNKAEDQIEFWVEERIIRLDRNEAALL